MKKSDNDKKDINEVVQRKIQTNQEFDDLKSKIQDKNFKLKLIEEHEEIIKRLKKMLKGKKR